ncbi:hypothetical protein SLE2022_012580 [Rubroshorea leprosula]
MLLIQVLAATGMRWLAPPKAQQLLQQVRISIQKHCDTENVSGVGNFICVIPFLFTLKEQITVQVYLIGVDCMHQPKPYLLPVLKQVKAGQSGTTSSPGSPQMQAWVQGAIAKISSSSDGVSSSTPNP